MEAKRDSNKAKRESTSCQNCEPSSESVTTLPVSFSKYVKQLEKNEIPEVSSTWEKRVTSSDPDEQNKLFVIEIDQGNITSKPIPFAIAEQKLREKYLETLPAPSSQSTVEPRCLQGKQLSHTLKLFT